jgi:hypothetical protein
VTGRTEIGVRFGRLRLYLAGLVAFLIGVPLSEEAFGQAGDIVRGSLFLTRGIIDSAGGS